MLKNFLLTNTSEMEGYGIEGLSEYTVVSDLDNFAMGRGGQRVGSVHWTDRYYALQVADKPNSNVVRADKCKK